MMPVENISNTEFIKATDTVTTIELLLLNEDGTNYDLTDKTITARFLGAGKLLLEKQITTDDNGYVVIRFDEGDYGYLGIGTIQAEIVVTNGADTKIFPNDGYLEFGVVYNTKSLLKNNVNVITLQTFEQSFSDMEILAERATDRANAAAKVVEDLAPTIADLDSIADRAETAATNAENAANTSEENAKESLERISVIEKEIDETNVIVDSYSRLAIENDDTGLIQRAFDDANNSNTKRVLFGGKTYTSSQTLNLYEGLILIGQGQEKTVINSSASGFAMQFLTPNGVAERQAPHFMNLKIIANNGIKLNDPLSGFTDQSTSQQYIMRSLIINCTIQAKTGGIGIGVQWSKCFDSHIIQSKIFSFSIPIDFHGCDICSIKHNRMINSGEAMIKITRYGTFGSQTLIQHNDLLNPSKGSFVVSSDRSVRIKDNYFEAFNALTSVISITYAIDAIIKDNRVEVPASVSPVWLDIQSEPFNLVVENNTTSGSEMGNIKIPDTGYKCFVGNKRSTVIHSGNTRKNGFPFNSVEQLIQPGKTIFVGSPHYDGLSTSDYGVNVRAKDGAFILPAATSFGSLIQFLTGATGNVNIGIVASSVANGQVLNYQRLNSSTPIQTGTITLTPNYNYYPLYSNVSVTDLNIKLWNADTTNNSDVRVLKLIVEYA